MASFMSWIFFLTIRSFGSFVKFPMSEKGYFPFLKKRKKEDKNYMTVSHTSMSDKTMKQILLETMLWKTDK